MLLLRFYAPAKSVTRETKIHYALYCARLRRQATIKLPPRSRANECSNIVRDAIKYTGIFILRAANAHSLFFFIPLCISRLWWTRRIEASDRETYFGQTVFVLIVTCVTRMIDGRPRYILYKNYLPSGSCETRDTLEPSPPSPQREVSFPEEEGGGGYWTSFQYVGRKYYTFRILNEMKIEPLASMNFS